MASAWRWSGTLAASSASTRARKAASAGLSRGSPLTDVVRPPEREQGVDRARAPPVAGTGGSRRRPARARASNMWWRTRWVTWSTVARGTRRRSRQRLGEARARDLVADGSVRRPIVAGLPMSWSERGQAEARRSAAAASTVRSVWSQRSSPGILFWGMPRCAARSGDEGEEQAGRLQRAGARTTAAGRRAACRAPPRCAPLTGGPRARRWPGSPRASRARSSKPSVAARRTARSIRSASSRKRRRGIANGPQERRAARSARPPNGSTSAGARSVACGVPRPRRSR